MAGDTPSAARISDRRRLAQLDPNHPTARAVRAGLAAPAAAPRRLAHLDIRATADKYYANQPPPVAARPRGPRPAVRGAAGQDGLVRVADVAAIATAIEAVVAQLRSGIAPVRLEVADQPADVLRRTRTRLEAQVTQERITEDQFRDVQVVPVSAAQLAAPVAPLEAAALRHQLESVGIAIPGVPAVDPFAAELLEAAAGLPDAAPFSLEEAAEPETEPETEPEPEAEAAGADEGSPWDQDAAPAPAAADLTAPAEEEVEAAEAAEDAEDAEEAEDAAEAAAPAPKKGRRSGRGTR